MLRIRQGGLRPGGQGRLVFGQRVGAACGSRTIDLPLREHRPQPGGKAAAAVKIAEQGLPLAVAFPQTEQIGMDGIGELARVPAGIDCRRGAVQGRTELLDEVIPGGLVPGRAGGSQREIGQVQRLEVPCDRRRIAALPIGERARDAAIQGGLEILGRQAPPGRLRSLVEEIGRYFPEYCFRSSSSRFAR